jgi:hypothetical protein
MLNFELETYLTDCQESTFVGEIAKNHDFCGGKKKKSAPVYPTGINHAVALRKYARTAMPFTAFGAPWR